MSGSTDNSGKISEIETIKTASEGLNGTISEELGQATEHFEKDNVQLLKHHGTYQQDNRDSRKERRKAGLDKEYTMMVPY